MHAALIFNGHASPTRHDGLCRHITSEGGTVLLVRPPGSAPHPAAHGHAPGHFSQTVLDASRPEEVARAFDTLQQRAGRPELVLFEGMAEASGPEADKTANTVNMAKGLLDWTPQEVERSWRSEALAALVVGRQGLQAMLPAGRGTVIFIGQSEEANPRVPFCMTQAHKAATRAVAQSMARGFGPRDMHVVHLALAPLPTVQFDTVALGDLCWQLHQQHRTAWTHELDAR